MDECLDRRLAKHIVGLEEMTVPQMGWAGIKNGDLLTLAQDQFDVFVPVDRNFFFQQNLQHFNISVMILQAATKRLNDLQPLVPKLLSVLPTVPKGQVRRLSV